MIEAAILVTASWYARGLHNPDAMTCASRDFRRGTILRLEHEGHTVLVRVNDYGPDPNDPVGKHRQLDLSLGAARKLRLVRKGVGTVRITGVIHP